MREALVATSLGCCLVAGCVENKVGDHTPANEYAGDLRVTPSDVDFGEQPYTDIVSTSVTLENIGDASLRVDGLSVDDAVAFSVEDPGELFLAPGETAEVTLSYQPQGELDEGTLVVSSSDPDDPQLPVGLTGQGLYPELAISPASRDWGEVSLTCSLQETLTLESVGGMTVTVDALSVDGAAFTLEGGVDLPLALSPGASQDVLVTFTPAALGAASGTLSALSDDPVGADTAPLSGTGIDLETATDTFLQGPFDLTDLLFTVDRSGSMDDDAAHLAEDFSAFIDEITTVDLGYQLMVVTEDAGCHNEQILTPDSADAAAVFEAAVFGAGGSYTEAGLTLVRNALAQTGEGACNEGFLRDDSHTMIIMVSDEPEQSAEAGGDLIVEILGLAPSAVMYGVVGPVPEGCATAAAGTGYDVAATTTGGEILSICDADWPSYAANIAITARGARVDTFALTRAPVPESVAVTVDGRTDEGWTYDEARNAVVYDLGDPPPTGSEVVVSYQLAEGRTCD